MTLPGEPTRWARWHEGYEDPGSAVSRRLAAVILRTREAIEVAPSGQVRLISVCAGQAHDVVGAMRGHPRAGDLVGRLVDSDAFNCERARVAVADAGLRGVQVVLDDAAMTDAYEGFAPADVLLLCGIFGNVPDLDIKATVFNASRLCNPGAWVIWTRHRRAPDVTPDIRSWFEDSGFEQVGFDSPVDQAFGVGTHRLVGPPLPFESGIRLFTFRD